MTAPLPRIDPGDPLSEWDGDLLEAHDASLREMERRTREMERWMRDQAALYDRIVLPLWLTFAAAIGAVCVLAQIAKWIAR